MLAPRRHRRFAFGLLVFQIAALCMLGNAQQLSFNVSNAARIERNLLTGYANEIFPKITLFKMFEEPRFNRVTLTDVYTRNIRAVLISDQYVYANGAFKKL